MPHLIDDLGTARRNVRERERIAARRQFEHEARAIYPSRLTLLVARLARALRARPRTIEPRTGSPAARRARPTHR